MKFLHTSESYSPGVGGVQEVVKHISERLVQFEVLASHTPFVSVACGNAADYEILYRSLLTS